ncbi:MAG TPA: (2Fe-2S)-binding protein [Mycobacteriales bacterium]|nr:(2Fe-2S)-binding protein [Mycobacteriales bacterium]
MLVCHCRVVSDRHIEAAVSAGALDTRSVVRATSAGTGCGGCVQSLRARIEEALAPDRTAVGALAG